MEIIETYRGKIKSLLALKDFRCIGGACSDSCCIGWEVEVDQGTYKAYQSAKESPLYERFKGDVLVNPKCETPSVDFATMRLTPSSWCPFLSESLWCDIQGSHGEAMLSVTCHLFPRTYNRIDDTIELSMTLSCPEVARLVFSSQQPLTWIEDSVEHQRVLLSQDVSTSLLKQNRHPASELLALRNYALEVLNASKLSIWQRLAYLNRFHQDLLPMHMPEGVHKIRGLIGKHQKLLKTSPGREKAFRADLTVSISLFERLYQELPDYFQLTEGHTLAVQRFLVDLMTKGGSRLQRGKRLMQVVDKWVNPLLVTNPFFIDQYLTHFVFKYLYPFSEEGDPYTANSLLVLRTALIVWHLAAEAEMSYQVTQEYKEITLERGIYWVQQLTKLWEHNRHFFDRAGQMMMTEGFDGPNELLSLIPVHLGVYNK